jgi:hypothetical protein
MLLVDRGRRSGYLELSLRGKGLRLRSPSDLRISWMRFNLRISNEVAMLGEKGV